MPIQFQLHHVNIKYPQICSLLKHIITGLSHFRLSYNSLFHTLTIKSVLVSQTSDLIVQLFLPPPPLCSCDCERSFPHFTRTHFPPNKYTKSNIKWMVSSWQCCPISPKYIYYTEELIFSFIFIQVISKWKQLTTLLLQNMYDQIQIL